MFPGAGASVIRNDAGEPVGWDYPGYDDGPYNPDDYLAEYDALDVDEVDDADDYWGE